MHAKRSAKTTVRLFAAVCMLPVLGLFHLLVRCSDSDAVFQGFSQALSLLPGKLGVYLRAAFYRHACPATAIDIAIGFNALFSHQQTSIGEGVYIGPQSNIGWCKLGRNCLLGSGVHILSGKRQHDFSSTQIPIQQQGGTFTQVQIGEDCWIGNGALIMADLGKQCVVAAGSVVTEAYPDGSIIAGNPAKMVRQRPMPPCQSSAPVDVPRATRNSGIIKERI